MTPYYEVHVVVTGLPDEPLPKGWWDSVVSKGDEAGSAILTTRKPCFLSAVEAIRGINFWLTAKNRVTRYKVELCLMDSKSTDALGLLG